jgi:low temperature requirement protein LtrA
MTKDADAAGRLRNKFLAPAAGTGMTSRSEQRPESSLPLRVSTLELFFDLVFVFTITQLTSLLAADVTVAAAGRVVLIFGVLWWMYGGYAWLTNTRTPSRAPERLLLMIGMAGFLIVGLAVPHAFGSTEAAGRDGLAIGVGYLVVVAVHGGLYWRVNRNIWRILPFNLASPLLVIVAGLTTAPASYALWAAALAVQVLGPVFVKLGGRFEIQPAHFVERHGALIIVVFGESVADIGSGVAGQRVTAGLALSAALGLALTASLWWAFFGTGDDDRAQEALTGADPAARPSLALRGYFWAYIPMLLGVVGMAAGLKRALGHPGAALPDGPALALACGVALFLAGDALFRRLFAIGSPWFRAAAAVLAFGCWPAAAMVSADAGITLLTVVVAAALVVEGVAEGRAGQATVET